MSNACAVTRVTVRDIMTRDVVAVQPEDTLRDVVEILIARRVGGAPVMLRDAIVGVISRTDILEFLTTAPPVPTTSSRFSDWSDDEAGFDEAGSDEQSTSFYTDLWDDAGSDLVERFTRTDGPEWDLLAEYTASAVMTRKLELVPPDAEVAEAARLMLAGNVHRLLVADEGRLLGVISMTDVLRALTEA